MKTEQKETELQWEEHNAGHEIQNHISHTRHSLCWNTTDFYYIAAISSPPPSLYVDQLH